MVFGEKKTMWFIGVEVEQETSAPPPKKNPGSAPEWLSLDPIDRSPFRHLIKFTQRRFLLY